jgi:hypothetical protein
MITVDFSPAGVLKGVELLILDAQTVDETKSKVLCPGSGIKNHTFTIKVSANVTGTVQLETANDPTYTGVWNPLGGGPIDLSTIGAAGELQLMFSNVTFNALRARIDTVVAGGTVSVSYLGN